MDINNIIGYLNRLSEAKLKLMREILSITEEQSSCTNEEKIDRMVELIQIKQEIIDKVNILDKEFVGKYDDLKKILNIMTLEEIDVSKHTEIKDLKDIISQIYSHVETIQQIEAVNNENMQKAFDIVKHELSQIKNNMKINNVYNKNKNLYGGVFIDKKK